MKTTIYQLGNQKVAEAKSSSVLINGVADALDLIANSEAKKFILHQKNISPEFFELRTGLAGEIMQKLVNYQIQMAIVGDFKNIESKSLKAFIIECNRGRTLYFAADIDSAKEFLSD